MEEGIRNHSDWFVGLNTDSSFEEVQLNIHNNPNATVYCPRPCDACHTAIEGERCYSAVMWVLSDGIRKQPESYKGLTKFASFQCDIVNHCICCSWSLALLAMPGQEQLVSGILYRAHLSGGLRSRDRL